MQIRHGKKKLHRTGKTATSSSNGNSVLLEPIAPTIYVGLTQLTNKKKSKINSDNAPSGKEGPPTMIWTTISSFSKQKMGQKGFTEQSVQVTAKRHNSTFFYNHQLSKPTP